MGDPARDELTWTLGINEHGSVVGGWAPGVECVDVVVADWRRRALEAEAALAAARQVDDAMVERAAEAAWESLRQRTGVRGAPEYNIALWGTLGQRERDAWRADTRAALLAALTPEPKEKR